MRHRSSSRPLTSRSPDEISTLNLKNAMSYHFNAEDASTLGNIQAHEALKRDGCALATPQWVDNHWSMILWKLAGEVQASPSLYEEKWSWAEVISQLKYR